MKKEKTKGLNWRHTQDLHNKAVWAAIKDNRSLNEYLTHLVELDVNRKLGNNKKITINSFVEANRIFTKK